MPLDQLTQFHDRAMPLGEHIEELRRRIIWAGAGLLIAAGVTFYFGFALIGWLAQPMLQAQDAMGFPPQTLVLDPTAGFTSVYIPVALISALIIASPWVIYQGWRFVVIGLYDREKRAVYVLAPFSTVMTGLAVAFTYYILLPVCLMFFLSFATYYPDIQLGKPNPVQELLLKAYRIDPLTKSSDFTVEQKPAIFPVLEADPVDLAEGSIWINLRDGKLKAVVGGRVRVVGLQSDKLISPMPQLGEYVKFAVMMMLGVVVAFQLPVVMLVAGWTGLFDPKAVQMLRKYAVFGAFAMGAVLTPTDITSMFVLALPLYFLFEFGLLLMKIVQPKEVPPPLEL